MRTIAGLFRDHAAATHALELALDEGFDARDVSLIAPDSYTPPLMDLHTFWLPHIGPIVTAGGLASVFTTMRVNNLDDVLIDLSCPKQQAHRFTEGVQRGGVLIIVQDHQRRPHVGLRLYNTFSQLAGSDDTSGWDISEETQSEVANVFRLSDPARPIAVHADDDIDRTVPGDDEGTLAGDDDSDEWPLSPSSGLAGEDDTPNDPLDDEQGSGANEPSDESSSERQAPI